MADKNAVEVLARVERLEHLAALDSAGGLGLPQSIIVWAPGLANAAPPVYSDWFEVEAAINELEGAARLIVDSTNATGGFAHLPAAADLDGRGRLEIVGGSASGAAVREIEVVVEDGAQIRNVRTFRMIVFRAEPTIRPPLLWDIDGIIVECFDATFLFDFGGGGTQPIIQLSVPTYMGFFFIGSSELRNSNNPGNAVMNLGPNMLLFWAIGSLFFGSTFDTTVSGPASSSIQLQVDASLPPTFSFPQFLGAVTVTQIDQAPGVAYTPASAANWNNSPPTNVQEALDRIAAKIGPIP